MDSLALAWRVMAAPDARVSASALFAPPKPLDAPRKKVIGVFRPWYSNSDANVRAACDATLEYLKTTCGYNIVDIELPLVNEGQLAHAMTIMMEVFNGFADKSFLQPANRILMAVASNVSANDFLSAQKVRQIIMQHLAHLFDVHGHDMIIVTPTTPQAGWTIKKGELKKGMTDGDATIRNMQYVWLANFAGCPAISCPVAYVKPKVGEGNVPVGLMGMGIWGGEEGLIEFGYECEKYLHEVLEGGRLKPRTWVDVIKTATEPEKKEPVAEEKVAEANGVSKETAVIPNGTHKAPVEETKAQDIPAAPAVEEKTEAAPTVEEKKEAVPTLEEKKEAIPAVEEKKEVVSAEEEKKEATPVAEEKKDVTSADAVAAPETTKPATDAKENIPASTEKTEIKETPVVVNGEKAA
jgi:hypothetical protein